MSRLLLFWLLFLLELVKDAGRFIGSLTLLKNGYEPKRVHGHHSVCFPKLALMRLGLRKKDLLALFLHCGLATLEVAKELHSTPHEFMHWHECRLLGNLKPTN